MSCYILTCFIHRCHHRSVRFTSSSVLFSSDLHTNPWTSLSLALSIIIERFLLMRGQVGPWENADQIGLKIMRRVFALVWSSGTLFFLYIHHG